MFYIYILYSVSSDKFYVGYTNDPYRRLIEHNTKPFNTHNYLAKQSFSPLAMYSPVITVISMGCIATDNLE